MSGGASIGAASFPVFGSVGGAGCAAVAEASGGGGGGGGGAAVAGIATNAEIDGTTGGNT